MPLSFLTRRGSKKTPAKAVQSRDASTITDQPPEEKRQLATSDGLATSKIPTPQSSSARRRVTTTTAPTPAADDEFLKIANDSAGKPRSRSRSKSVSAESQQLPTSTDGQDNTNTLKYLQSLSQPTARPSDKRRAPQDSRTTALLAERHDNTSSASSRTATITPRPANQTNEDHREERRSSIAYHKTPSPTRLAHRPSEIAYNAPEGFSFSTARGLRTAPLDAKKQRWSQHDDLESQASTAAQSGLWDELHELKSRMRKLESSSTRSRHYSTTTPSVDPSSILDRPKTGTTHTTTSASRRSSNNDHLSPTFPRPQSSYPDYTEIHPLLHSALRKTKLVVTKEVFVALESSASDALQLAACARANTDASDMQSIAASALLDEPEKSQKAMIRKSDNLCRSLTELCIVLCEQARTTSSSSNAQNLTPRSPGDTAKAVPSALAFDSTRPTSSDRSAPISPLAYDSTPTANGFSHNVDSPLSYLDSRRQLSERITRLQNRANERSLDTSRLPDGRPAARHGSVVETSTHSPWTPKPLNRAATTANPSTYTGMPQDPAELMESDSSSSDDDEKNNGTDGRGTIRANRPHSEATPSPSVIAARRTIGSSAADARNHSPRDLRLSKDYTQRHPLPEALSPSIRRALEHRNSSNHSVASSRTARAGSVGTKDASRTNGVKRASVRTTELRNSDEDSPLSPTSGSEERPSGESRRGSKQDTPNGRNGNENREHARNGSEKGNREQAKGEDVDYSGERTRRSSTGAGSRTQRLPPSTGAGLAERLEAKRQQRLGTGSTNGSAGYGRVRA